MICHVMTSCISRHLIAIRTKYVPGAVRVAKNITLGEKVCMYMHSLLISCLPSRPLSARQQNALGIVAHMPCQMPHRWKSHVVSHMQE